MQMHQPNHNNGETWTYNDKGASYQFDAPGPEPREVDLQAPLPPSVPHPHGTDVKPPPWPPGYGRPHMDENAAALIANVVNPMLNPQSPRATSLPYPPVNGWHDSPILGQQPVMRRKPH